MECFELCAKEADTFSLHSIGDSQPCLPIRTDGVDAVERAQYDSSCASEFGVAGDDEHFLPGFQDGAGALVSGWFSCHQAFFQADGAYPT
mgnify:CR=1 FL=1